MKMLKKVEVIRLKQVEHINSERAILAEIKFPFIVNLLCTFQDEKQVYMLLEYVVGGELFSHLRKAGRFGNEMTRFYASEITLAIEFLHSKNIIYRDLKPENLVYSFLFLEENDSHWECSCWIIKGMSKSQILDLLKK